MKSAVEVSQSSRLTMPLAFIGLLLAATYALAMGYSKLVDDDVAQRTVIADQAHTLSDHEQRIRAMESLNARIDQKLDRLIDLERQKRPATP